MMNVSRGLLMSSFIFLALWFFYIRGTAPNISSGDAAELSTAVAVLGTAHSPGYPFFVLMGKSFERILPWGNIAYRTNLFSSFCTSLALALLGISWGTCAPVPATALVLAGLAPLIQRLSRVTEVFGLNLLMAAAIILILFPGGAVLNSAVTLRRRCFLAIFVFAVGLTNQQTLLLIAPAIALWFVWNYFRSREKVSPFLTMRFFVIAALLGLAGLSLYGYLFVRSRQGPLLDWEDPETLSRFWKVVTRSRYGTLQLAQGSAPAQRLSHLGVHARFFWQTFVSNATWAGVFLLVPGLFLGLKEGRLRRASSQETGEGLFYLIAFIFAGPLFLTWAGVSPSPNTREMLERFLLLPILLSLYYPIRGMTILWRSRFVWARTLCVMALGVWGLQLAANSEAHPGVSRWNFVVRDHGNNVLRSLPPRTALFSDRADETEFSLAYLTNAERRRPDVRFMDANAGVTKSLYGKDYYEIWGKPRLEIRQRFESAFLSAADDPVFYATLALNQIDIPRRAAGIVYEARETGDFTRLTRVPYWDLFVWRLPPRPENVRDKHLLASDLGLMGDYALGLKDWSAAGRLYGTALRYSFTHGLMTFANALRSERRHDEAESLYRRLTIFPDQAASAWNNLGVLFADRQKWDKALESYRQSLTLDPENAMAHYNIGVVHWHNKEWTSAAKAFRETARLQPDHPAAKRFAEEAERRARD